MNCQDYRRALLAEPHGTSPDRADHLAGCTNCARYTDEVLRFEARLGSALRLPSNARAAPGVAPSPVIALRRPTRRGGRARPGWWAAAASVLLAVVVAGGLWLAKPGPTLAADVVAHMAGEPAAWTATQVPVPGRRLDAVLAASKLRLKGDAGLVTYASSCLFRGYRVPHLVVQTAAGPITVMLLTHESARAAVDFDEQGYRGMIVPVPGHGSLAVLERSGTVAGSAAATAPAGGDAARGRALTMPEVAAVAARVRNAIQWTG
jgi:hypothetical protein